MLLPIIEWLPMSEAPRDCTWIEARDREGYIYRVHYACGDGSGLMPPFDGFFREVDPMHLHSGFIQVTNLIEWRLIK